MAAHALLNDDFTHVKCLIVPVTYVYMNSEDTERAFAAYPHKAAYGFGRIQGPKFRRLGSVDG